MPKNPPKEYTPFEDAMILWECDFPSKPELLESLIKERIALKDIQDTAKEREKEINASLLAFFNANRIPGVKYEGFTIAKKSGVSVNISKESLLKAGVSKETIEACISRTPWDTVECRVGSQKDQD